MSIMVIIPNLVSMILGIKVQKVFISSAFIKIKRELKDW